MTTRADRNRTRGSTRAIALTVPGLWSSNPDHWQSLWEAEDPTWKRIQQVDWQTPLCADWVSAIDAALPAEPVPVVLVAHSLGCAAVAHWAELGHLVSGALLVAPADVDMPGFPKGPRDFAPMPLRRLDFPSMVVASSDDQYCSVDRASLFAAAWGSTFVNIGPRGHINADSGLGRWPDGRMLLEKLLGG